MPANRIHGREPVPDAPVEERLQHRQVFIRRAARYRLRTFYFVILDVLRTDPRELGARAEMLLPADGEALSRSIELAYSYLKVPEITRRNTRVHFTQPLKERIVREVGYGLSLEGASAADLVKSMQAATKTQ
jgi:hypothetical protein